MCKIRVRIWVLPIAISLCTLLRWGIFQFNASCCIPEEARIFKSLELKKREKLVVRRQNQNILPKCSPLDKTFTQKFPYHCFCWQWRTSLPKYAKGVKDDAGLYLGLAPAEGRKRNWLCPSVKEKQHPRLSVGHQENGENTSPSHRGQNSHQMWEEPFLIQVEHVQDRRRGER